VNWPWRKQPRHVRDIIPWLRFCIKCSAFPLVHRGAAHRVSYNEAKELLHVTCGTCGYEWDVDTADSR